MDSSKLRYKNWDELINYCNHSASPVGRFVVDLHHKNHPHDKIKKIYLGTDDYVTVFRFKSSSGHKEDLKLDRIYLPMDCFRYEQLKISSLEQSFAVDPLQRVIKKCLSKVDIILSDLKIFINNNK